MAIKLIRINGLVRVIRGLHADDRYFMELSDEPESCFSEFCANYIRPDDVAFDIGANIGLTSLILADFIPQGVVYAFEPSNQVFKLLERNVTENTTSQVVIHNLAVSDVDGESYFLDNSAYGHLADSGILVRTTTIESFAERYRVPKIDFIKIDIEGSENHVLKHSLGTLLQNNTLIYFEFNSWCQIAIGKTNPLEFLRWLIENFPELYVVRKQNGLYDGLVQITGENALSFLHDHLVYRACIDDLVATTEQGALQRLAS